MVDIVTESIRAAVGAALLGFLLWRGRRDRLGSQRGWRLLVIGFALILMGEVLDITDNFERLNRFVLIGDTETEALLEKVAGYLIGGFFLFLGALQWIPLVGELRRSKEEIRRHSEHLEELVEERSVDLRRANAELTASKQELQHAFDQLESFHVDQQRFVSRTLEATEAERRRLAVDLHDGPVQKLAALGLTLDHMKSRASRGQSTDELVRRARDLLFSEIEALRKMMVELRPPALDARGLAAALEDCVGATLQGTELEHHLEVTMSRRPRSEVETVLYRITQEALTNVVRHAAASVVEIHVQDDGDAVELQVRDDGVGYDGASDSGRLRFGLTGMRERAELVGGELRIESAVGKGTRVVVRIPRAFQATEERMSA